MESTEKKHIILTPEEKLLLEKPYPAIRCPYKYIHYTNVACDWSQEKSIFTVLVGWRKHNRFVMILTKERSSNPLNSRMGMWSMRRYVDVGGIARRLGRIVMVRILVRILSGENVMLHLYETSTTLTYSNYFLPLSIHISFGVSSFNLLIYHELSPPTYNPPQYILNLFPPL